MSSKPIISLTGIQKVFPSRPQPLRRLWQAVTKTTSPDADGFVALQDVNLDVQGGESLGIVGQNGAGKSTLLQIIAGTLQPSAGVRRVEGQIGALLELGAGFNPLLSGRENVFLAGAIQGLSRDQLDALYEEIVSFSELEAFMDQPVRTYSSGMTVRLAFSIATSFSPHILVIDEALSVGDGAFARKSFDRIARLREQGCTLLFCSHSLFHVEALCQRALWLHKGQVTEVGVPSEVIKAYQGFLDAQAGQASEKISGDASHPGTLTPPPTGFARFISMTLNGRPPGAQACSLRSGDDYIELQVLFDSDPALPCPSIAAAIHATDGRTIASAGAWNDGLALKRGPSGRGMVRLTYPRLSLLKGRYTLSLYLFCERGIHLYESAEHLFSIDVTQQDLEQGLVRLERHWFSEAVATHSLREPSLISLSELDFGWVTQEHYAEFASLFEACFDRPLSHSHFKWKYCQTARIGRGAFIQGRLVAFYGGVSRGALHHGQACSVVQIGDVMVDRSLRGLLARKGAFARVAEQFIETEVGDEKTYWFGYGFPHERAMVVAERLGLYTQVDRMVELVWTSEDLGHEIQWSTRTLTTQDSVAVDALWKRMAKEFESSVLGVRDSTWLLHRYLGHPDIRYDCLITRHRLSGRVMGVLVLRQHQNDSTLELVDLVAEPRHFGLLIKIARRHAARLNFSHLLAWCTESHTRMLLVAEGQPPPEQRALPIVIPANSLTRGPALGSLKDHWFLMSGDSDFR